ncbi:uncharacterized protein METZ01_LOCUS447935 [marine metagenome]|uniref:Uncharacterized protein n=1 Tax=marine metagenome TaxID=408172 RepID=A0A382ZHY5_9ZZZZ
MTQDRENEDVALQLHNISLQLANTQRKLQSINKSILKVSSAIWYVFLLIPVAIFYLIITID